MSSSFTSTSPLPSLTNLFCTFPDTYGVLKESDETFWLSFYNGDQARRAIGLELRLDQWRFVVEALRSGPFQSFLCQFKKTDDRGSQRSETIQSVLDLFPDGGAICVKSASSQNDIVIAEFSNPVDVRRFSLDLRSDKPPHSPMALGFHPLVDGDPARPCLVCKAATHATKQCPWLCVMLLETEYGLHPRVKASSASLVKHTQRLADPGPRLGSVPLALRSKTPDPSAAAAILGPKTKSTLGNNTDTHERDIKQESDDEPVVSLDGRPSKKGEEHEL